MKPKVRVKALFFDSKAVLDAVGKAGVKVLSKYGSLVRKRAQKSLRYADDRSKPGEPPHAHRTRKITRTSKSTGKKRTRSVSFLREFLWFKFDPTTKSVVIGPERLNSTLDPRALPALEYGGPATVKDRGKTKMVSIKARPFMGPADAAERPGLPAMWKYSVR